MVNANFVIPRPHNETVLGYAPGSRERAALEAALKHRASEQLDIPCIIGGEEVRTGRVVKITSPHDHSLVLGQYHEAGPAEADRAVAAALSAQRDWAELHWSHRASILLKAAELITTRDRARINAMTMLGISKTAHQAEIDAVCELADFWRMNAHFMTQIYDEQPASTREMFNRVEYRPLEGFVFAIAPFNFTAISANLSTAPMLMGNSVLWKPAPSAVYAAWSIMEVLIEAGVPPGVLNFIPGQPADIGDRLLTDRNLAGVHFTGSTATFAHIMQTVGSDMRRYRSIPRLIGETGGKDFILAHASADVAALATAIVRGGFEYQGQKCSAASRVYVPDTLWPALKPLLIDTIKTIKVGDTRDLSNFMGAVIDERSFNKISGYLDVAKNDANYTIHAGGTADRTKGWFVQPTLVQSADPRSKLMTEEIFGPVVTLYVYPEKQFAETLELIDTSTPYALTGAVFAQCRKAIDQATRGLVNAAGNYYINDKPTGAVVGQQPFGGARASGTNDKAGSRLNLERWVSPRTIKETYVPPTDYRYPYMG